MKTIICPKCDKPEHVIGMDSKNPSDFSNINLIHDKLNNNYDFYYCKTCDVAFDE